MSQKLLSVRTLAVGTGVLVALGIVVFPVRRHLWHVNPFPQSGNLERRDDWQPFGGAWQFVDGAMLNNSDERGAKLMYGDIRPTDYLIEADVQLLGQYGDAGLIVRANNE